MLKLKKPQDVGDLIGNSFKAFAARWQSLVGLQAVAGVASVLILLPAYLLIRSFGIDWEGLVTKVATPSAAQVWSLATLGVIVILYWIGVFQLNLGAGVALVTGKKKDLQTALEYSWQNFWLYVRIVARSGWYIVWPALAIMAISGLLLTISQSPVWLIIGGAASVVITVQRKIEAMLAIYAGAKDSAQTGKAALEISQKLIKQHWWLTFGAVLLWGLIMMAIGMVFGIPNSANEESILGAIIALIPNLFLPGLNFCFGYEVYRRWSK